VAGTVIQVKVRQQDAKWLADVPECPGVHTFAENFNDLDAMVREALAAYFDIEDEASFDLRMEIVNSESTA
jgi:predicted RNase H-like HicB family nuclease